MINPSSKLGWCVNWLALETMCQHSPVTVLTWTIISKLQINKEYLKKKNRIDSRYKVNLYTIWHLFMIMLILNYLN